MGNEAWWNSYRGNLWTVLGPGRYSTDNPVLKQVGLFFHLQSVYPLCLGWAVPQRDHWCKDFWFCERYLGRPKRSQDCHSSKWASSCGDRCVTQIIRFLLLWSVLWAPVWYVEVKRIGQATYGVFPHVSGYKEYTSKGQWNIYWLIRYILVPYSIFSFGLLSLVHTRNILTSVGGYVVMLPVWTSRHNSNLTLWT